MARWCSALWPHSVPFLLLKTTGIGSSNQNKEQSWRTTGHQQMLVIHCFGFWLWLTCCTSQTSRQFLCLVLVNRFDAFSCLSSYFFFLFSSPSAFTVIIQHSICCDGKMMCYRKNEALFTPQSVSWPKPSLAKSWTPVEKHWTAHWRYNTNTPRARQWQPAARTSSVFVSDYLKKKEASVWQ